MNSTKLFRFSAQLKKLPNINGIPVGRRFSTNFHLLRQYSRGVGIAGAGILSCIAYGLTSDSIAYALSKKRVSKFTEKYFS